MKKTYKILTLITMFLLSNSIAANELIITKSFTGGWYDPAKSGQGFLLEIIKSNNQKKALTTWFTFDQVGNQFWLIGLGEIENQSIIFQMFVPEGGKFGDLHNPANMTNSLWGDVTFTFNDCNHGVASWTPIMQGFSAGSMPVVRNTAINNLHCTGGLFDELGDTLTESELITSLSSTGVDADAYGKTKYQQRTDRIDYSVEIEDLPLGVYQLFVEGVNKGSIEVVSLAGGKTEGEIEFRDPVEPGKIALDFNPQNKVIDIVQNGLVYLSSDGSQSGGNNGGNTSPISPAFGNSETERYMVNTGVYPLGQAKVKLKQRPNRVDFQVELEDVPVGFYDFNVDAGIQGVVRVIQTPVGLEGELEFRNPIEAGKELLDFNPLGAMLSVTQGPDVLFVLEFPAVPGSGNGGSDDDCDTNPNDDDCDDGGIGNTDDDCDTNPNDDDCDDGGNNGNGGNTQNIEIELDFNNVGVDSNASGKVEYEIRSDRRDFKVEVEDLDFGSYQLVVGGQIVTTMVVNSEEVEVEFRDPVEPGKLLLNFDPLNKAIEIKKGGIVYLSVVLQ